jgi:hypothetical protein
MRSGADISPLYPESPAEGRLTVIVGLGMEVGVGVGTTRPEPDEPTDCAVFAGDGITSEPAQEKVPRMRTSKSERKRIFFMAFPFMSRAFCYIITLKSTKGWRFRMKYLLEK